MIGNYAPPISYLREPEDAGAGLETFRHELRRGCLSLAVLTALRAEQHGYALRVALAGRGLRVEHGTLYPLLRRLEAQGLLESEWRLEGKRRKRFYRLTARGRTTLDRLLDEWRRIDASLTGLLRAPQFKAA